MNIGGKLKKISNIIIICCLLISTFYVPRVSAKTLGDLKSELNEFETNYKENKLQKELSEQEIASIKSNINSINNTIYELGNNINSLNDEIYNLNEQIKKNEEEIKQIIAFTQVQNGESAYLEYAFGAADFTDFIYRIAVSEQLTTYNDALIDECNKAIELNKKKTEELANKKEQMYSKQASLKVEVDKLKDKISDLDEESLSIEEQIAAKKSEIKVYEDKGCKDNEDISTCGRAMLPADTVFWRPLIRGQINGNLGLFGPRTPCGGSVSCYHHGMDFGGDSDIYSAANGTVMYVLYRKSCGGNSVFIQHNVNGQLIMTGYLHLQSINVKEGQNVTKNTVIGIMGGTDSWDCSTGRHLHFEMSTGNFTDGTYYSYRYNPRNSINLPSAVYSYWSDKTTRLK